MLTAVTGASGHAGINLTRALISGGRHVRVLSHANNRNVSHAKATAELGYAPRTVRETLSDTLQWFKDNGYIKGKRL